MQTETQHLYEASQQWSSRSPDQRFWDVNEFESVMKERESRRAEIDAPVDSLRFIADGEQNIVLSINAPSGPIHADMNNLAFRQIVSRLGYVTSGLDPELITNRHIVDILNYRVNQSDPESIVKMLLEQNGDTITVLSATSDSYARLNNTACVTFLRKMEGYGFRLPPARPVGFENERTRVATEKDVLRNNRIGGGASIAVGDLIGPAGLYAGDEDMFAFMVADSDENLVDDGTGNCLMQGYMMRNSDVGVGAYNFTSFIMQGVCGNHIIWDAKNIVDIKYRHIGEAVTRIHEAMGAFTPQGAREQLDNMRRIMAWMTEHKLGSNVTEVVENVRTMLSGKNPVLTEKLLIAAYTNAAQYRDRDGDPHTYAGFMNAITRYSQTLPFQNVRKEVDKAASKLITVAQKQMG